MSVMKKKNQLTKRILMTIFGMLILGFAVGLLRNSNLGVDPFQCMCIGIWNVMPLSYGTTYLLINVFLFVFMFLLSKKLIGIYTFINMFFIGYVIDYSDRLIRYVCASPSVLLRVSFMVLGLILVSIGCAFIFSADLGVSTYDWIALRLSCKKLPFRFARIITDLVCCGIGFSLGSIPGIATVVLSLCMGPFISFFRKRLTDPMVTF